MDASTHRLTYHCHADEGLWVLQTGDALFGGRDVVGEMSSCLDSLSINSTPRLRMLLFIKCQIFLYYTHQTLQQPAMTISIDVRIRDILP